MRKKTTQICIICLIVIFGASTEQKIKYMPLGYDKFQDQDCSPRDMSSSVSKPSLNLWTFLTTLVVVSNLAANIINNVNSNNNNNNNNNNEDNQNTNNFNQNANANENMNMNMITMGRMLPLLLDKNRLFSTYLKLSFHNAIHNFHEQRDRVLAILLSTASGFVLVDWFPNELRDDTVFKELYQQLRFA